VPKFFSPVSKYWKCVAHYKCYQEKQKSSHFNTGSPNQHFVFGGGNDITPQMFWTKAVRIAATSVNRETESIFPPYVEQMPEERGHTPSWETIRKFSFRTPKLLA